MNRFNKNPLNLLVRLKENLDLYQIYIKKQKFHKISHMTTELQPFKIIPKHHIILSLNTILLNLVAFAQFSKDL